MIKEIMPKFGLSMEEGTIAQWLCAEGDYVKKGQPIAEIESEKITNTAEASADGILRKIVVKEGETAQCGEIICIIADADENIEDVIAEVDDGKGAETSDPEQTVLDSAAKVEPVHDEIRITPRAKKLAEEKGLEYSHIKGTGIGGAITVEDVLNFGRPKSDSALAVKDDELKQMTTMQRTISKSMFNSLSTTAQTTLATEANVEKLVEVYSQLKPIYASEGVKLSYTAMLVKAVAHVLESHPDIRTQYVDEKHVKVCSNMDIGVAVDVPNGLVVPVIRNANQKDLRTICLELAELATKARSNRLIESDLGNAATTLTNLGMFDITYFTPILNLPESTILGVGSIVQKPVFRNGAVFFEHMVYLSLTHDHRVSNGASCARFLKDLVNKLQNFTWR